MQLTPDECQQICEEVGLPLRRAPKIYHAVMRVALQRERPPFSQRTAALQQQYGVADFPFPYVFVAGRRQYPIDCIKQQGEP